MLFRSQMLCLAAASVQKHQEHKQKGKKEKYMSSEPMLCPLHKTRVLANVPDMGSGL